MAAFYSDKKYKYTVHHHYRGKSVHADLRLLTDIPQIMLGWTMDDQVPGKIIKPVDTVAKAKEKDGQKQNWKINWNTGAWNKKPMVGTTKVINVSINSQEKEPEPASFINFKGIIPKGEIGSTKNFPGVLTILTRGQFEYGVQKKLVHEYFFSGKALNYRLIFRKIQLRRILKDDFESFENYEEEIKDLIFPLSIDEINKELKKQDSESSGFLWLAIKPVDQMPLILQKKEINSKYIPPKGVSNLPEKIRKKVPADFQYWKFVGKKNLEVRQALIDAIKKKEVDLKIPADVTKSADDSEDD